MLATAQNGGPATFVAINNMFSASPSSLPSTPGAMLSMPSNMMSSNIGTTQGMNTTQFILPPNNFTPNPTNLTCTVPLSSPPQLQGPILPFFAPGSGGLLSSNPVSLSVPSPFGTHMHHFVQPGQSNSLSSFSSTVSSSGNVSTVPVSLFPSNNHISLTSVSSNILSSQPMVLPTFPVSFNNQAQTNSVGILPIPLGMNQPLSSNPMTETTNSFLMSSPNYTTPIYTATLYPLSTPAILPATTIASLPSHLSTTSYSSSASSSTVSMDYTLAPSSVKSEKPLLTLPPKVTGIKNIEALEAVDFHRDAILDAIDKLRERKARPDFERISCLLKRHQNINYEQTQLCLQRLADAGAVVCVDYKGNLSYRNPSKWRKTAATSGAGNKNLPSVSNKLVDAIRRLMDNNPYNQSTKTCTNLIPFSQPGPNGGYSVLQIERALQFLIGGDEIDATNPMPQLTGATLRVCLDREATHGKLAKTIDGRYVLDETGERKKAYQTTNIVHTPQMANKKLLPPNTLSNAYLTSNGSCSKSINKLGSSFDRNNTLTRLHPLAAKQTSSTTNGKPMTLPITPNFSMPPLTSGRRGRPPGSKAKKTSNEINSCEKKIRVENSSSTYGNASIIGGSGGRLDSNACSALTTTSSIFVPDSTNTSNLIPTSCFTSNIINDLPFSSSLPVLPSSSFITVIASSSNNCPNMLPGTILPGHFSAASSIPIDSSLMTTISSPFLSFPLSQGLPLPSLFPSTSNVLTNTSQLTIPMKHNGLSTPDSFISDIDSCGTDKQMGKESSVCCCCGGLPTCEEAFLICKDCGLHAHPTCLDYWPELTERARQSPWQCSDCKTCTVCNNREYKSDLIICDACDKGFHIDCHQPKLVEPIDRSLPWVCTTCQNEGYRVAIGTLPTGMNSQNSLSFEKINNSNNYTNSPLKEINSSHDSIRIETKIDLNKSVIEESLDKSIESSSNSSIDDMNSPTKITPTTTTASNIISNENILVNSINPTNHSVILSPTRSYSITSTSSVDNNISEEVNMNTTISNQMDSGSLQKDESSTSSTPQESTENANRISPSTQTSTSDLHLHQSNIGNNKDGDIGLKNGTEAKKDIDIMDNDDDDGVNDDNHESISTRPNDVSVWSVDHVQQWLLEEGFPREAEAFYQQEIDGTCLLLMKRMDVLTELGIKLGPAVKIYERIKRFQSQCGSPS
ncbi:unnamed protein product [Heterobilharzia americana]|nr:unnamed protein product [Heterobilharzia americana]